MAVIFLQWRESFIAATWEPKRALAGWQKNSFLAFVMTMKFMLWL
jgi:hypothetical protein